MLRIHLNYNKIIKYLITIFSILLILHVAFTSFAYLIDGSHKFVDKSYKLFNFDTEQNIPTFFNCVLFLISAVLFFINGYTSQKRIRRMWYLLGTIFIYFSIDEFCSLHEILIRLPRYLNFETSGLFYFFWVVPYGIASLVLFFFLIPFIKKLPPKVKSLFIISAIIYITGAIVIESISGIEYEKHQSSFLFQIMITMEESFEMLGLILAIYTNFLYLNLNLESMKITFPKQALSGNAKSEVARKELITR